MADERSRSASPIRDGPKPKKQKTSGFKWKEKRPRDEDERPEDSGRLERGYRDRSPRRNSYHERERDRDSDRRDKDRRDRSRDRQDERKGTDSYRVTHTSDEARTGDPLDRPSSDKRDRPKDKDKDKSEKKKKPKAAPVPNEPMIIVNINDRLGTKAAIPCFASDSVKNFKALVAMQIGRQPHEIMLKRQGERPFKDQLTLEDYGVSNGVQLDLELDTGD